MSKAPLVQSFDGQARTKEQEQRINVLAQATFNTPSGQEFLDYLKSITIHAICGPEISAEGLRHREGMRHLVAIIEERRRQAK